MFFEPQNVRKQNICLPCRNYIERSTDIFAFEHTEKIHKVYALNKLKQSVTYLGTRSGTQKNAPRPTLSNALSFVSFEQLPDFLRSHLWTLASRKSKKYDVFFKKKFQNVSLCHSFGETYKSGQSTYGTTVWLGGYTKTLCTFRRFFSSK